MERLLGVQLRPIKRSSLLPRQQALSFGPDGLTAHSRRLGAIAITLLLRQWRRQKVVKVRVPRLPVYADTIARPWPADQLAAPGLFYSGGTGSELLQGLGRTRSA